MSGLIDFFHDPTLRAPTIGAMCMCLSASLVGVVAFIRRRSLLGEALSHATYPGVLLGVLLAPWLSLPGALCTALLGLVALHLLQHHLRLSSDSALCVILVSFLGFGTLIASRLQFTHPLKYQQVQTFLYGQSVTMVDRDLILYGLLALATVVFVIVLFEHIKIVNFDRDHASLCGMPVKWIDTLTLILLALAIVVSIRSIGIVLTSGMLVAPAIAARRLTHHLKSMFIWSGLIGTVCGLFGTVLSVVIPHRYGVRLPTGPSIVLLAGAIAIAALLLAPHQGLLIRALRVMRFRHHCHLENILKHMWKSEQPFAAATLMDALRLRQLKRQGFCQRTFKRMYCLTQDGHKRASHIIRLHRLWEVYLTSLGVGADKVHHSAEEMEHIITPEMESLLTDLLQDPKSDPHSQPIPTTRSWN